MKYVVLLSDGMAGRTLLELNGRTTLEAAADACDGLSFQGIRRWGMALHGSGRNGSGRRYGQSWSWAMTQRCIYRTLSC